MDLQQKAKETEANEAQPTIDLTNKTLNELQELEETIAKTLNNAPVKLDGESEILANLEAVRVKIQDIKATDLTQQAHTLTDAPFAQQLDFICTAPEDNWKELLEIVLPGACPKHWANKRKAYDPDWQAKASKKAQKRKQARKAYAKNGRSVYPSKKHNNNGTYNGLGLSPA